MDPKKQKLALVLLLTVLIIGDIGASILGMATAIQTTIGSLLPIERGASSCNMLPNQLQTTCQVNFPKPFVNNPFIFIVDTHPPTSWWEDDIPVFDGNMSVVSNGGTWTFNCEILPPCSEQPLNNMTLNNLVLMRGVAFGLSVVFRSDQSGNCLPSGTRLFLEWSNANNTLGNQWEWWSLGRAQNIANPHARPRMNVLLDCSIGTGYDSTNAVFNNNSCSFGLGSLAPFTCNNNSTQINFATQDLALHSNVTGSVDNFHDPYWCPPGVVGIQNSACKMRPVAVRAAIIGPAGSTQIQIYKITLNIFQQQMANIFIGTQSVNFFAFGIIWQQMPTFNANQDFNFNWIAEDLGNCPNLNAGCSNF